MRTDREVMQQALTDLESILGPFQSRRSIEGVAEALRTQLAKPDDDPGPWFIRSTQNDKMRVCSHDPTHDAELELSGDFADRESRDRYAQRIADRLNAAPQLESKQ